MTQAERKAVHFVLLLLAVSTLARFLNRPKPLQITTDASALDGIANPVKSRKSSGKSAKSSGDRMPPIRIDPNRATVEELDRLPGVGPAVAERIVNERKKGRFGSVVELSRVRGITRRKAIQLAPYLVLPLGDTMPPARAPTADRTSASSTDQRYGRAGARTRDAQSGSARMPAGPSPGVYAPINLNRATEAELEAISGVGPALARRIVEARTRARGFRNWEQVDSVSGIGPALLAKLKAASQLGPR